MKVKALITEIGEIDHYHKYSHLLVGTEITVDSIHDKVFLNPQSLQLVKDINGYYYGYCHSAYFGQKTYFKAIRFNVIKKRKKNGTRKSDI